MIEKPAETQQPIHQLLAARWSGRALDPDIPVSEDQIIALCEAANWAPSCFGDQPWRFIIWNKHRNEQAWQQALSCLSPGNQQWAQHAPLLFLASSVATFRHNEADNRWAGYDTGAASLSLCLQATSLGLVSHQMGGFDNEKLTQLFHIPETLTCHSIIAIGHPAPLDTLSQEQLERELAPRERRPLSEHFFLSDFNTPLTTGESR